MVPSLFFITFRNFVRFNLILNTVKTKICVYALLLFKGTTRDETKFICCFGGSMS